MLEARWRWLLLMPVILTPPYVVTNRLQHGTPVHMPLTAIDRLIPGDPAWAWAYLLLFPLMWAAVLVQSDQSRCRNVVLSCAGCALVACTAFTIQPTAFARPGWPETGLYGWVTALDSERNACPSLHGAYALLGAWWIGRSGRGSLVAAAGWAVGALILVATIGVRQHGVIDLGAGVALGASAAMLVLAMERKHQR